MESVQQPKRTDTLKSSFQETDGEDESGSKGRRRLRRPPTQGSRRTKSTASSQDELTKHESTFAESEANPRDFLENRLKELEKQTTEVDEQYEQLSEGVKTSRHLFEVEQEDCEDIVAVVKRNIERVVARILDKQAKKRELQNRISCSEMEINTEDRQKRNKQAMEEESRTRNIIILQTKILILEGRKFQRDGLLDKIKEAEKELMLMDERHSKEIAEMKADMIEKYEKLCYELQGNVRSVSEQTRLLSQSQQVAALKQRQQHILDTQSRYKQAASLLLQLYDRNKELRDKVSRLKKALRLSSDLAQALQLKLQKQKMPVESKSEEEEVTQESLPYPTDSLDELKAQIKDLETKCFRMMDYKLELQEIMKDQEQYKATLSEKDGKRHIIQEKLATMSEVAQNFLLKNDEDIASKEKELNSDFLQRMSSLLAEAVDPENVPESCISSGSSGLYEKGFVGLIPKKRFTSMKIKPLDESASSFSSKIQAKSSSEMEQTGLRVPSTFMEF